MAMTNPKPVSWRNVLRIHPAADLFPPLSEAELAELAEDIKKHGLRVPVTLWAEEPGKPLSLLDGRGRLDAMELAGLKTVKHSKRVENDTHDGGLDPMHGLRWERKYGRSTRQFVAIGSGQGVEESLEPDTDPYAFVVSMNVHRRHLSKEQKIALMEQLDKERPGMTHRQMAKIVKLDHETVSKYREGGQDGEFRHPVHPPARARGNLGPEKAARLEEAIRENPKLSHNAIAKMVGVNIKTVQRARKRLGIAGPSSSGERSSSGSKPRTQRWISKVEPSSPKSERIAAVWDFMAYLKLKQSDL